MSNTSKQLVVFLDSIGRTIIGKISDQTEIQLSVENPALVHVQANPQTNQLQLQLLPLFFKEFLADKNKPTVWNYKKASITISEEIVFAPQFIAQYEQIFAALHQPSGEPVNTAKVVKLFDEE